MILTILSFEDKANIRETLECDLDDFWRHVRLEVTGDVDDAWSTVEDIVADGDKLAVVLSDRRLSGESGVDFLVEFVRDPHFSSMGTVLVTGQTDQDDTIRALNKARLDHYIAKLWDPVNLQEAVRRQLTDLVLEAEVNPLPYLSILNSVRVMEATHQARYGGFGGDVDEARREQGMRRRAEYELRGVASSSGAFRGETIV